jgi:pyruvate dehydrogenase E2 component (dihydrolipoamide acetyltransferase)
VAHALADQPGAGPRKAEEPDAVRTPLSGTRKIIAQRMLQSHLAIPQFTLDTQADVTSLLALRSRLNAETGMSISVNDFIMKATAVALASAPYMLCSIDGDELVEHRAVNLGMAVALETGLVVPVIRDADRLTLSALARQSAQLAARARDRKLSPDETTGGTFTVSNLGMYGVTSFTPLINPPQAAILGVNAARTEVWLDGGQPKERKLMTLSLSVDHRVIDGAQGALFLQKLVTLLESPYQALI